MLGLAKAVTRLMVNGFIDGVLLSFTITCSSDTQIRALCYVGAFLASIQVEMMLFVIGNSEIRG